MNSGRSDASTSTDDDIKQQPLCLFYFAGPCGVLCREPPRELTAAATADLAAALRAMDHLRSSPPAPAPAPAPAAPTSGAPRATFELGAAAVHARPVSLVRRCEPLGGSSLELWLESSSSSEPRRLVPYCRLLPPLQLPAHALLSPRPPSPSADSSSDCWTRRAARRCLPPLELPPSSSATESPAPFSTTFNLPLAPVSPVDPRPGCPPRPRRTLGVHKIRRKTKLSGVRRMVSCLMLRAVKGIITI